MTFHLTFNQCMLLSAGTALGLAGKRPLKGFILHMWTGTLEDEETGLPLFFETVDAALAALKRYPSWGRHAVEVWSCTRVGRVNFCPGEIVAHGS